METHVAEVVKQCPIMETHVAEVVKECPIMETHVENKSKTTKTALKGIELSTFGMPRVHRDISFGHGCCFLTSSCTLS